VTVTDQSPPLDADPLIFTGVPATAEEVLQMLADPDIPITPEVIEALPPEQQPDPDAIADILEHQP
jgi:hypothetical protein